MKAKIIATLVAIAVASRVALAVDTLPSITTTDGKTYEHITELRTDPDGLYVEYAPGGKGIGSAKIKFSRLSADLQKQYGYDADAARKYEDATYKANQAFQTWADKQQAAAEKARADAAARDFQEEMALAQRPPAASQSPAATDTQSYDNGMPYTYYGGGYAVGVRAPRHAWTGTTFQGLVPQDQLFTPLGFSPTKTQFIPSTPRGSANVGGRPADRH